MDPQDLCVETARSQEHQRKPVPTTYCHWRFVFIRINRNKEACTYHYARAPARKPPTVLSWKFSVTILRWSPCSFHKSKGFVLLSGSSRELDAACLEGKSFSVEIGVTSNESVTMSLVGVISCHRCIYFFHFWCNLYCITVFFPLPFIPLALPVPQQSPHCFLCPWVRKYIFTQYMDSVLKSWLPHVLPW